MPWLQLILESDPAHAEQLSEALTMIGASAVTLQDSADQPLYEPPPGETPLWSATRVVGLFDADTNTDALIRQLSTALTTTALPPWRISPLEDKDWEREWMKNFHPMRFGQQLWICPSWQAPPDPQATNILLDPGLAFGTGTHPTTALCLRWLDEHGADYNEVIDYGCGSGVLAVAAAKLGAKHVWAVDNDPQALLATRDNAAKNTVAEIIEAVIPESLPRVQTSLLIANILAQPLLDLADNFAQYVIPGGHIILSGILKHQAEMLVDHYQTWFKMEPLVLQDEWVRLAGKRLS